VHRRRGRRARGWPACRTRRTKNMALSSLTLAPRQGKARGAVDVRTAGRDGAGCAARDKVSVLALRHVAERATCHRRRARVRLPWRQGKRRLTFTTLTADAREAWCIQ
jgi:hypothetical protein